MSAARVTVPAPAREAGVQPLSVFMMDLWSIVPYYTAYLTKALAGQAVQPRLGAITYHYDTACFARQGLRNDPGLLDLVGRSGIRRPALRRGLKFAEWSLNVTALAARLRAAPPDIVHVQFLPLLELRLPLERWFCRFLQRRSRLVYTVHDVLPFSTGSTHRERYGRMYRAADALICHTRDAQRRLTREFGIAPERIWVIPHGPMFHDFPRPDRAQARARLGLGPGDCMVLSQGFVKPYKGTGFLLDAWRLVQRENPRARLLIAGNGSPASRRALEQKVVELEIGGSVRLDFRFVPAEELPSLYQAADVLVYPFDEITQSGSLMTGLSFGKPVVATALPAFEELLRDGETALLCPYGDAAALAGALTRLIRDENERARLAQQAAQVPEPWESIAARTVACYRSLRGEGGPER